MFCLDIFGLTLTLVEKPISVNKKQLLEMIRVAKENNVLIMEAMWTHFLPSTTYVKKAINLEETGKLLEAKINFGYSLVSNYDKNKRLLNPNLAGGSLLDIGVYPISFFHFINKANIKTIKAKATYSSTLVDLGCDIEIVDEFNAKITIKSRINEELDNNAILKYENKTIKVIDFTRSKLIYVDDLMLNLDYAGEGFTYEIEAFSNTILNNLIENNIRNFDQTIKTIETMDKIRELINLKYPFEK